MILNSSLSTTTKRNKIKGHKIGHFSIFVIKLAAMVEDQLNFLPAVSPVQPSVENLIGDLLFYSFSTLNMNHFKSMDLKST